MYVYNPESRKISFKFNENDPGTVVAILPPGRSSGAEAIELLVSRANLGLRDERLLDDIGRQIATRNDT